MDAGGKLEELEGSVAQRVGAVRELTSADFEAFVGQDDRLVVVDFYADWCGTCRMLAPMMERVAAEYGERVVVGKLDVDAHRDIAQRMGVEGIPDVRFYRSGKQVDKIVGVPPERELRQRMEKHLSGGGNKSAIVGEPAKVAGGVPRKEPRKEPVKVKEPAIQPMKKNWLPPGLERK